MLPLSGMGILVDDGTDPYTDNGLKPPKERPTYILIIIEKVLLQFTIIYKPCHVL